MDANAWSALKEPPSRKNSSQGVLAALSTSALKPGPSPHHHSHPRYLIPLTHRAPSLRADAPHPGLPSPGSLTFTVPLPAPPRTTQYPHRGQPDPAETRFSISGSNATAPADVRAPEARGLRVREHAPNDRRHLSFGPREAAALVRQFMGKVIEHMTDRRMVNRW